MKYLISFLLVLNVFAVECENSAGYSISIDGTGKAEISTPSESVTVDKVNQSGTYYFATVNSGSIKSFTLEASKGELKLIQKLGNSSRMNIQALNCKN